MALYMIYCKYICAVCMYETDLRVVDMPCHHVNPSMPLFPNLPGLFTESYSRTPCYKRCLLYIYDETEPK